MLWTRRPKWSLASESLIMSHHYLLSYTGSPSVSVLFLRSYCTPLRHSMVWLQRTWLSSSVLMFLGELLGLLTNFYWSSQRTSSNWLAWWLSQCERLTSGTRFHLRLKAAHLSLSLKLSWRPIFFDKHISRLSIFSFFWFLGLLNFWFFPFLRFFTFFSV